MDGKAYFSDSAFVHFNCFGCVFCILRPLYRYVAISFHQRLSTFSLVVFSSNAIIPNEWIKLLVLYPNSDIIDMLCWHRWWYIRVEYNIPHSPHPYSPAIAPYRNRIQALCNIDSICWQIFWHKGKEQSNKLNTLILVYQSVLNTHTLNTSMLFAIRMRWW